MPCQCGTEAPTAERPNDVSAGCGCDGGASGLDGGCGCGTDTAVVSDREIKLERLVMDLDKRLRLLEGAR